MLFFINVELYKKSTNRKSEKPEANIESNGKPNNARRHTKHAIAGSNAPLSSSEHSTHARLAKARRLLEQPILRRSELLADLAQSIHIHASGATSQHVLAVAAARLPVQQRPLELDTGAVQRAQDGHSVAALVDASRRQQVQCSTAASSSLSAAAAAACLPSSAAGIGLPFRALVYSTQASATSSSTGALYPTALEGLFKELV